MPRIEYLICTDTMSDNRVEKFFPLPGDHKSGGIPIIGQPQGAQVPQPVIMTINCILMPKLKAKLDEYCEKSGLPPGEIGATIMRLGLLAFSANFDDDNDRIENPDEYIPKTP